MSNDDLTISSLTESGNGSVTEERVLRSNDIVMDHATMRSESPRESVQSFVCGLDGHLLDHPLLEVLTVVHLNNSMVKMAYSAQQFRVESAQSRNSYKIMIDQEHFTYKHISVTIYI